MHEKRFDGDIARLRAPARVARLEVDRVVSLCLEGADFKNVLDVGAGTGLFSEAFAQRGLIVTGIDANPEMVAAACVYVPEGEFREAEAEALPYPDASFDFLFLSLLLHESDEPLQVLKETRRVARHKVCILEWPYQEGEFGPPLIQRIKPEEIIEMAKRAGFSECSIQPLTNLTLYIATIRDKDLSS